MSPRRILWGRLLLVVGAGLALAALAALASTQFETEFGKIAIGAGIGWITAAAIAIVGILKTT